ncbi:alpha-(1-_3)-arabinofuranosyltransferase domain-containing protein [Nonomuraea jiangxiensis]|uniref:Arabinofuranan 3-O-arabinosyltransferase n=1 Tax=Nonomuraea jiangxiensis TaxID=633440 RepID=A0A1G8EVT3_9ACTN|nr:alpha-(1->3)-arabinofuranosyltransferase family protein [Nonomuraea jiangxiensis]SDH73955.1 arabinofuranan 3-O-arabinosyltransferase [Nonomuraea jiangxiensis]
MTRIPPHDRLVAGRPLHDEPQPAPPGEPQSLRPGTEPTPLKGEEPPRSRVGERAGRWSWLLICCLGFAVLAFTTRPGNLISDTKMDLALNPVGWLERAAHLWDLQHFGQLQNQVAGYVFPMGPFFVLGDLAGVEPWVTQRLWLTLLMCVAFLGVERLGGQLRIGTPGTRLVAALAYALAPRTLSILGEISIEWLPAAMLPWILIPLLTASETGQRARAAVRSALAVALCGGVNAVAVLAVLVAPVLYILTRPRPVPRWRLLAWWSAAVSVATLFWWLPLLLVGRYAFSFLPYTETAGTTTQVTSLTNVLRGASDWVRYLPLNGVFEQPPGFTIATSATMIVVTGGLAALGLAGLARRDLPARGFVVALFLVGVAALVAGHASALEPIVAEPVRLLLDGPLAPLRNLRKFDPLVRLALVFGLAHLLAGLPARARLPLRTVSAVAFAALVLPVFNQGLAAPGDFRQVPAHWREAAAWLDRNAGDDGVLVVPGAKFGEYVWGRPMDEPLQALTTARWTTRQITPPGSVGLSRLLDAIDQRLTSGRGSAGVTAVLRRMGVRYLLVRNDLIRQNLQGAWPSRIYEALRESPGVTKVRSFGEPVGDRETDDAVDSVDAPFPALDLYEVGGSEDLISVRPVADALAVRGGPDSLLAMGDLGLLGDGPVLVNGDAGTREVPTVVSDALRLRERSFGEIRSNRSPTLTADRKADFAGVGELDLLEEGWLDDTATAEYHGIAGISASSSAADPYAIAGISSPGRGPWAAMDGNVETGWESGGARPPRGEWLRVDLPRPMRVPGLDVMFAPDLLLGQAVRTVAVETEAGSLVQDVRRTTQAQRLRVPAGPTGWVRIKVVATTSEAWSYGQRVGIVELAVPGVLPGRTIRLPGTGGDVFVMDRGQDGRPACMRNMTRWVCNEPVLAERGEETGFDRTFSVESPATVDVRGSAVLRDPELIDRFTRIRTDLTSVTGSSQITEDAVVSPRSAFDGDAGTTWIPDPEDAQPTLTLGWKGKRTISRLQLGRPGGDKQPLDVVLTGDGGAVRAGRVSPTGTLTFKALTTSTLKLRFSPFSRRLQVTELVVPGLDPVGRPADVPLRLGCGLGPRIEVNGRVIPTKVTGTHADLLEQRPVRITGCSRVRLAVGDNRVRVAGWDAYGIEDLVVGSLPDEPPGVAGGVVQAAWTQSVREVRVSAPKDAFLVVNENYNAGWRARAEGKTLRPVRIDGWKQGWELPAGTSGTVRLEYVPDRAYWLALVLGLAGIALLALIAVVLRGPRPEHVRETAAASATRMSRWRAPYAVVLGLAFGGWVASWPGMLAVLAAVLVTLLFRARGLPAHWLAAAAFAVATLCLAAGTELRNYGLGLAPLMDQAPQLAACAAVGVLFGQLVTAQPRPARAPELPAAEQVLTGVR